MSRKDLERTSDSALTCEFRRVKVRVRRSEGPVVVQRSRLSGVFRATPFPVRSSRRLFASGLVLALAVLGACGADPGATVSTLRPLSSTNYATTPPSSLAPLDPANTAPPPIAYTIKQGDSVYGIAAQFGVRPDELASYNNWAEGVNRQLLIDETILIPPSPSQTTTLPGLPIPTETTVPPPEPARGNYEVKLGDGLSIIADKCGVELSSLLRINGWPDMNVRIMPGDTIKIPASSKSYEKSECDGV